MIWRWLRRGLFGLLVLIVILIGGLYFVASTESGTEWLLARAKPFLPLPLRLEGVSGTLMTGLSVDQVVWRSDGIDVAIDDLTVSAALRPLLWKHLSIETLSAQKVRIVTTPGKSDASQNGALSIELPLEISVGLAEIHDISITAADRTTQLDRISLSGTAADATVQIANIALASDWLQLDGRIRVQLSPPYDAEGSLDWTLENVVTTPLSGLLKIDGNHDAYQVSHTLRRPTELQTVGTIWFDDGNAQIDLKNNWDSLEWQISDGQALRSQIGELEVSGGLEHFSVNGNTSIQLDSWPVTELVIEGQGDSNQFDLTSLRLESALAGLVATGSVRWVDEPNWEFGFGITELQVGQLQDGITGAVDLEGTLDGTLPASGALALTLNVDRISGELNDYPVSGAITISKNDEGIVLADSWVALHHNRIDGNGRLAPGVNLALEWELLALEELLSGATGQSRGDISLRNSGSDLAIDGEVSAAQVSWRDNKIASLAFDGRLSTEGNINGDLNAERLRFNEQTIDTLNARVSGIFSDHVIQIDAKSDDGTLNVRADGGYGDHQWSGVLETFAFADGERSKWTNEQMADLNFGADSFELDICLREMRSPSRVCVDASYNQEGATRLQGTIENVPLARLPINPSSDDVAIAGSVGAEFALVWQDSLLNGSASLNLVNAAISASHAGESIAAVFEHGAANVTVADNQLDASADLRITGGGSARSGVRISNVTDRQSAIAGSASIELTDLSFVPLLLPSVSDTRGTINGALDVGGQLDAPTLGGDIRLDGGAFRGNNAGVSVTDIALRLRQADSGQLSLYGSAHSGEGEVSVTGESSFSPATGLTTEISITGENFEFVRLPEWQAVASPNIQVTLDNESVRVRGALDVPRAKVTLKSLPDTAENVSSDAVVHGRETTSTPTARRFDIDVEATLGEDVELSGFGLETKLTGALRLRGGSREPFVGIGRIELRDGRYEAYGQELSIESGALLFSGPLTKPTLDISATRQVSDVTVGLKLSGTPNDLRSTVFSEPLLSDAEALSYLIAGRPLDVADDEDSTRVGQAALALGLAGADKVAAQIQTKLGLDSLSLGGSDDVGRIVAGRRIGGRLLVEYGYGLVDRLGTLLLRYQLNDRLVVETTSGTTSTLDVVYSVKKD